MKNPYKSIRKPIPPPSRRMEKSKKQRARSVRRDVRKFLKNTTEIVAYR